MWRSGPGPRRKGKPMNNTGRRDEPDLISAKEVALGLPKRAWRTVTWREGSAGELSSRFARVGHNKLIPEKLSPEWLLIEWPEGAKEPTKYWLSTLPATVSFQRLVGFSNLRSRVGSDYPAFKHAARVRDAAARRRRLAHHHATLCVCP